MTHTKTVGERLFEVAVASLEVGCYAYLSVTSDTSCSFLVMSVYKKDPKFKCRRSKLFMSKESKFEKLVGVATLPLSFLPKCRCAFSSFLSDGFTTMAVIDQPERKLARCTSLHRVMVVLPSFNSS